MSLIELQTSQKFWEVYSIHNVGLFRGRVTKIDDDDPDEVWYHVKYEDGDSEDYLEDNEYRETIELHMKLKSERINEWEKGNRWG